MSDLCHGRTQAQDASAWTAALDKLLIQARGMGKPEGRKQFLKTCRMQLFAAADAALSIALNKA
eukprot:1922535-Prorocentrum_lima.AAC.1